jgi:tetratricopeptide (TPR) repeat protein
LNKFRLSGNFAEARASGETSLALARETGEPEQLALTLNDLAHVYGMSGAWPEHRASVEEAAQRWRALGNLPMLADSLATAALYASFRGDYATARRTSDEAGQIAQAIGNVWGQAYSLSGIAYVLLQRADYAECVRVSYECLRLAEEAGYMAPPIMNRAVLADALADLGQLDEALRQARAALAFADGRVPRLRDLALGTLAAQLISHGSVAEASALAQAADLGQMGEVVWASEPIRRAHVEAALAQRSPEALRLAEERLRPLRRQAMLPYVAEALLALARAQRQAGQPAEAARPNLEEALALCEQLGARRIQWRVLLGLAAVAGDPAEAAAFRAASRGLVMTIAGELPEASWREGFLGRVAAWEQALG